MPRRAGVTGDKDVIRAMRAMPAAVATRQLDVLCKESLEPLRMRTKQNALPLRQPGRRPKGGHLDEGVVVRKRRGTRYKRNFWVAFGARARKIAHLVNFGTAPHWQPRRGIMHPGARAKPFFTSAYEQEKDNVVDDFSRGAWSIIRAAVVRLAKR